MGWDSYCGFELYGRVLCTNWVGLGGGEIWKGMLGEGLTWVNFKRMERLVGLGSREERI